MRAFVAALCEFIIVFGANVILIMIHTWGIHICDLLLTVIKTYTAYTLIISCDNISRMQRIKCFITTVYDRHSCAWYIALFIVCLCLANTGYVLRVYLVTIHFYLFQGSFSLKWLRHGLHNTCPAYTSI